METFYFLAGVCAVILLMMVVGTFVNYLSVKQLKDQMITLSKNIESVDEARGKQHFEHIDYADQLYKNHEDNLNELYKYVDSRTDKMADGISKHIADINSELKAISERK